MQMTAHTHTHTQQCTHTYAFITVYMYILSHTYVWYTFCVKNFSWLATPPYASLIMQRHNQKKKLFIKKNNKIIEVEKIKQTKLSQKQQNTIGSSAAADRRCDAVRGGNARVNCFFINSTAIATTTTSALIKSSKVHWKHQWQQQQQNQQQNQQLGMHTAHHLRRWQRCWWPRLIMHLRQAAWDLWHHATQWAMLRRCIELLVGALSRCCCWYCCYYCLRGFHFWAPLGPLAFVSVVCAVVRSSSWPANWQLSAVTAASRRTIRSFLCSFFFQCLFIWLCCYFYFAALMLLHDTHLDCHCRQRRHRRCRSYVEYILHLPHIMRCDDQQNYSLAALCFPFVVVWVVAFIVFQ